jgi:hypothetical protein
MKFIQTKRAPKSSKRKEREETPFFPRKNIFMSRALDNGEDQGFQGKACAAVVTPALDKQARIIPEELIRKVSKKAPPAPSTPSRHTRKAGATPRTPEGELSSRSCHHQALVDFHSWNHTYFTEEWLKRELTLDIHERCFARCSCELPENY